MKQRIFTWLQGAVLSSLLGFSAIGCLCTGFSLPMVDLWLVALLCVLTGIAGGLCYCFRLSLVPLGALALGAGFLWQSGMLEKGAEALLYRISMVFHSGYSWPIVRWSNQSAAQLDRCLPDFICLLAILLTLVTVWTVCRGKPSILACLPGILPVLTCFVVTDTLPDLGLLFVFLAVFFVLLFTSHSRQQDTRQANRLTLMVSVPIVLALGILFLAVPESTYQGQQQARQLCQTLFGESPLEQLWDRVTGQTAYTGNSVDGGTVDLTRIGIRLESGAEVMRVNTRYTGTLYLRGRALDGYSGTQWYDTQLKWHLPWPDTADMDYVGSVVITTKYAHQMLYVPYYIRNATANELYRGMKNEERLSMYSFSTVVPPDSSVMKEKYRVWKSQYGGYRLPDQKPGLDPQLPEDARIWAANQLDQCVELPEDTWKWAQTLLKEIIGEEKDHYEVVQRIGAYVRNSASYDLQTKRMPGRYTDFARWFLESSDTGYCVHFASAATVLLRAAGIPARYVTGYMVDVEDGVTAVVRGKQAHAWAEYWLPGYGWAILEATPSAEVQPTVQTTAPTQPNEEITVHTQPSSPSQPENTPPAPNRPSSPVSGDRRQERPWVLPLLWVLIGILGAVGTALGQWKLRLWLRLRKLTAGDTNRLALARWQDTVWLCRILNKTPPRELFSLAQKAKFSQYTLTEQELNSFLSFRETAVAQLKKQNLFKRLWYRLILCIY